MQKKSTWMDDASKMLSSHEDCTRFHSEEHDRFITALDFVVGNQWTAEERELFKKKKKTPVVFNYVAPTIRTAVGLKIQNKYAVKFAPFEPEDQPMSDTLEALNTWTSNQQNDDFKDIDIFRIGWAAGRSYQMCYMEVYEDGRSRMKTENLNPLQVYWDPASKQAVTREDASFVDVVWWLDLDALIALFPEKEQKIRDSLDAEYRDENTGNDTDKIRHKDRQHESQDERDGAYKVIERIYKKRSYKKFAANKDERTDFENEEQAQEYENKGKGKARSFAVEEFYQAVICPSVSNAEFLSNEKYHCQPRMTDPDFPEQGQLIFPVLEFVAESINGTIKGFVEDQIAPNKLINGMLSNMYHNVKHSASAPAKIIDASKFKDEKEAQEFVKFGAEGDRIFRGKNGDTDGAVRTVEGGQPLNNDVNNIIQYAAGFQEEASAAPKALKGMNESGVSGVLNEQRIQQAYTQHQEAIANWKMFLKMRIMLRYAYWREYWTDKRVIRITNEGKNDYLTINEPVWETDQYGYPTGNITKWNDINAAPYDIVIEDSTSSPSVRAQNAATLQSLLQSAAVQQDSVLFSMITMFWLDQQNTNQKIKDGFKEWSTQIKQFEQQKKAAEQEAQQLNNTSQMQQVAQTEAQQTAMPPQYTQAQPQQPAPDEMAAMQQILAQSQQPQPVGGIQ